MKWLLLVAVIVIYITYLHLLSFVLTQGAKHQRIIHCLIPGTITVVETKVNPKSLGRGRSSSSSSASKRDQVYLDIYIYKYVQLYMYEIQLIS